MCSIIRCSSSIRFLHRKLKSNRTRNVYRKTKLEAYIYEPFFTMEIEVVIVTGSQVEVEVEGWGEGRW